MSTPLQKINDALRNTLAELLDAKHFRVAGIRKAQDGWSAEVEAFVRDPRLSIVNDLGAKDIYIRSRYKVEFDRDVDMVGFTEIETGS